jgi:hypothetical protein
MHVGVGDEAAKQSFHCIALEVQTWKSKTLTQESFVDDTVFEQRWEQAEPLT